MSKILSWLLGVVGIPTAFMIFFTVPTMILAIPAWIFSKKNQCLFLWEIGFPIYSMIFWLISLVIVDTLMHRGEGVANIYYELFVVSVFSLFVIYIRSFILYRLFDNQRLVGVVCFLALFIFTFLVRLLMPTLSD